MLTTTDIVVSRVVGVLDSGEEGPGFKSQPQRCRVTVLHKLFTPIVPLFTKLLVRVEFNAPLNTV